MKKIILVLALLLAPAAGAKAQSAGRFSFATTVGTGVSFDTPASVPFMWQVMGYYTIGRRFFVSAGTGLSVYEKTLIPFFGGLKFNITAPRKFTPYLECAAGYGFAPDSRANGGLYLSPSVGVQWAVCTKMKLLLAAGYELQQLERLKTYGNSYFTAAFKERLNHNTVSIRVGVAF